MKSSEKKLIYVVGCGRSGTTLLGFALGNSVSTLDLGEVLDFVRLRGRPNDFGPETENYGFWRAVVRRIERDLGRIDFTRLATLERLVDTHTSLLASLVLRDFFRKGAVAEYRRFVKALYDGVQAEAPQEVFVDSSKYPSRLTHLLRIYPDEKIYVIHLIRNPIELARAWSTAGQAQPKSFGQTMVYFFAINALACLTARRLGRDRYLRLHYEDLVSEPEAALKRIGDAFSIDTAPAIERIQRGEPLHRGYVFNGNRMRMQERVVFRRSSGVTQERSWVERGVERFARLVFGSITLAARSSKL